MGALIPLALAFAPQIGDWLFGTKGAQVAGDVAHAVQTVTGTVDPEAAQAALAADPKLAASLRIELAKIGAAARAEADQAALQTLAAGMADTANARAQTIALAQAHSAAQWGPVVVSVVILAVFGVLVWSALTTTTASGAGPVMQVLLGMLGTGFAGVIHYWMGSSAGSDKKTELLYRSTPRQGSP